MVNAHEKVITITLPDGKTRTYPAGVKGIEIARSIGEGLAKAAIGIQINGVSMDLSRPIEMDAKIAIVTLKTAEGLDILRHDTAHILAQAVQELFKDVQVTIGPNVEDGFYYDFARDVPFNTEDLGKIEAKMQEIIDRNVPIERVAMPRTEAIAFFKNKGEHYKAEIIDAIPEGQEITLYRQGDFIDLCRGPHGPTTGFPKAFKLMKVAGAYWRGDARNKMLQRIYGTAWANDKDLKQYLHRLEEAHRRDHRKLGKEMELFHIQEEAVGQVFWHSKGWLSGSENANPRRPDIMGKIRPLG
jgi:threonyl-tRNA synthetase